MRIVFFGTSSFSVTILKHLLASSHSVVAVVTRPDKPQGRSLKLAPPPVKMWLQENAPSIPLHQPAKASAQEFVALMQSACPDVFVVAAYGEIMKSSLLGVPRLGPINVHASLLPKWRGAAPIQRSLMAGETETGVTIMKMVLEMDAGDMLATAKVHVPLEMNHAELEHLLATAAEAPLLQVLSQLENGMAHPVPQDMAQVTFAPKITSSDAIIDWTKPAIDIHNQIRALAPEPGAWTEIEVGKEIKKLKIKRSMVVEHPAPDPKSTHFLNQKEWVVGCGKNLLKLLDVQLEGKKNLPIGDFLRGLHHPPRIK